MRFQIDLKPRSSDAIPDRSSMELEELKEAYQAAMCANAPNVRLAQLEAIQAQSPTGQRRIVEGWLTKCDDVMKQTIVGQHLQDVSEEDAIKVFIQLYPGADDAGHDMMRAAQNTPTFRTFLYNYIAAYL